MKVTLLVALLALGGCRTHPTQRFVPTSGIVFALDTKTGQQCITYPKGLVAKGQDFDKFPYCIDLYNSQ